MKIFCKSKCPAVKETKYNRGSPAYTELVQIEVDESQDSALNLLDNQNQLLAELKSLGVDFPVLPILGVIQGGKSNVV